MPLLVDETSPMDQAILQGLQLLIERASLDYEAIQQPSTPWEAPNTPHPSSGILCRGWHPEATQMVQQAPLGNQRASSSVDRPRQSHASALQKRVSV